MNAKDIALIKALSGGSAGGSSGGGSITVDSELSATSTNPVQNKVIKSALDALSGALIVTLTKDETHTPFTSASRAYTADKTVDEVYEALFSGKNVILRAKYIDGQGTELEGVYHFAGFYNGEFGFIDVKMSVGAVFGGKSPIVGYDAIILTNNGVWVGSYTNLMQA